MHLSGQILTPSGLVEGTLDFAERITGIAAHPAPRRYILPGFIDVHVHGGGGGDTMDGPEGVRTLARFHARHGTTTLLPTTITNPWERVLQALEGVRQVRAEGVTDGADILGAHLEGPFVSPQRLGAQPPNAILPDPERLEQVLALDVVRVVTLAPELEGALEAGVRFAKAGVRVSLGHTAGDYEQACTLIRRVQAVGGVAGATHLYNAMGGLQGRDPGPLGAVLASEECYAELILDLEHVHAGSFRAAYHAKGDRLLLITDAMRAAGMTEGESELGGQKVIVREGRALLENGTLAGSVLTLDRALRNAVSCGVPLAAASRMLSDTPARYLGLGDRGRLEAGLRADIVVFNAQLDLEEVWVAGRRIL
ncbi:N-acetylglucosamine-6-phosphate deacetylase [Deinobacterium chartae]|uniref:N-acetylglucosamine-6-phosphate deacetylase n=1 Tax=Deinobacterium chartae TaxID=521158 RepID=A0A841I4G1_9DEIO|nr:N-acetylglucosamine-6-phosphate deacetylase [Deinobacterium chartae]MBB6099300.1 N-acetylglucosamine-6-phosphate deacetylase [Deinobacterium chartae]